MYFSLLYLRDFQLIHIDLVIKTKVTKVSELCGSFGRPSNRVSTLKSLMPLDFIASSIKRTFAWRFFFLKYCGKI